MARRRELGAELDVEKCPFAGARRQGLFDEEKKIGGDGMPNLKVLPGSLEDTDDSDSSPETLVEDDVPDGGYGWVVVFAMFMINCCTWGVSIVRRTSLRVRVFTYQCFSTVLWNISRSLSGQ